MLFGINIVKISSVIARCEFKVVKGNVSAFNS